MCIRDRYKGRFLLTVISLFLGVEMLLASVVITEGGDYTHAVSYTHLVWILYRESLMSCGFMENMPWSAIWSVRRWDMEPLRLAAAGEHPAISIILP